MKVMLLEFELNTIIVRCKNCFANSFEDSLVAIKNIKRLQQLHQRASEKSTKFILAMRSLSTPGNCYSAVAMKNCILIHLIGIFSVRKNNKKLFAQKRNT